MHQLVRTRHRPYIADSTKFYLNPSSYLCTEKVVLGKMRARVIALTVTQLPGTNCLTPSEGRSIVESGWESSSSLIGENELSTVLAPLTTPGRAYDIVVLNSGTGKRFHVVGGVVREVNSFDVYEIFQNGRQPDRSIPDLFDQMIIGSGPSGASTKDSGIMRREINETPLHVSLSPAIGLGSAHVTSIQRAKLLVDGQDQVSLLMCAIHQMHCIV